MSSVPEIKTYLRHDLKNKGIEIKVVMVIKEIAYQRLTLVTDELLRDGPYGILSMVIEETKENLREYVHGITKPKASR